MTGGGLGGSPNPIGGGSVGGGAMGDRPGTGSVHSDVRTGPGEQYGGLGFGTGTDAENARQRAASATREFADDVRDRAEHLGERARDMADEVRTKAERLASDARGRLEDVRDRAEDLVGEGGITARIRENPVAALAIGFGLGYLIAGRGARRGPVHFAKSKLRKALFGAATAALLSEARGLVTGELRSALLGDDDDDERPRRPSHRERF